MKNLKNLLFVLISMAAVLFAGCKAERLAPAKESVKDITGKWKVVKAIRNGTDITALVDFSQFRVNFQDGKYTLTNKLPFLVSSDGTYALDDPQYPFQIKFTAGNSKSVATAFNYPIVNGARQLSITFSPGCLGNTYVYVFQQTTN